MMKQVKFNLYVDQQKIRTIEELKGHFNIDDLIEWYEQGVLQKWLSVRNYEEQFGKINGIDSDNKFEIATQLIATFQFSEEQSRKALDSLNYRINYSNQNTNKTEDSNEILQKYFARYEELKEILLERVI